jgi:dTDP-D-glucose 4,6-dehydratase
LREGNVEVKDKTIGPFEVKVIRLTVKAAEPQEFHLNPKVTYVPTRFGEIGNFAADTLRLRTLFGKTPSTSLDQGLTETFRCLSESA